MSKEIVNVRLSARCLAAVFAVAAMLLAVPALGQDEAPGDRVADTVSLRLGLNFSVLSPPDDPPGGPTLLEGSAFTGAGLVLGVTYELARLVPFLNLEAGVLYGRSSASGFEIRAEQEREVLLEVESLRFALWAKTELQIAAPVRLVVGLGPEAVVGFASGSTVREKNIPLEEAQVVRTKSVTALHLTGILGLEIDAGPVVVPLSLHLSVNPLTGATTAERLLSGEAGEPGPLAAEFDFELLGLFGIAMEL